ncbi:MAG TPA: hypothetical protein EYQ53_04780 [Candidatus Poseidoniales archaeon]|jgi:chaperonin GroEL (HSP60 family)|nr:MAG: hypothetical protein CXT67_01170 [Euryarchaeota archaeon]HIG03676.1 hypothetical protein [Candidatus Poseidoniales archaeon]
MNGGVAARIGEVVVGQAGTGEGPVVILRDSSTVTSGVEVQQKLISAAIAFGNILRRTYGPKGLDKMMYKSNGEVAITNDGAKIVSELMIKHPAAKAFVSLGEAHEEAAGDGVTGCILFAAELMQEAGRLLSRGLHPLVLIEGYAKALEIAIVNINQNAICFDRENNEQMTNVAMTALGGKFIANSGNKIANLISQSIQQTTFIEDGVINCSSERVILAKSRVGDLSESRLIRGVVIDKKVELAHGPRSINDANILLLTSLLGIKKTTIDAEIEITSPDQLVAFLESEDELIESKANAIVALGVNALFCQEEVDNRILHKLVNMGVFVINGIDANEMKYIASASGAKLINNIQDCEITDLGFAGNIEVLRKENNGEITEHIYINQCKNAKLVTIEVGGAGGVATEEVLRSIHDALRACQEATAGELVSIGGGFSHTQAALEVRKASERESGRERLAMEAFARALEVIPRTLAINSGGDALDKILELRSHIKNDNLSGIDASGDVSDVSSILEPTKSLIHALGSATETTATLLRIDQVISARGD